MRTAFLLLVLANLLFLSWTLGYFGEYPNGREPQRLAEQLRPESIRVISAPVQPPVTLACKRIRGIATTVAAEALRSEFETALGKTANWTLDVKSEAPTTEYWVGIPSLTTTAVLEKKKSELIAAKFDGLKVVEEGKGGPYTILISRFPDEVTAKQFLEAQNKTLRSARMISRESEAKFSLNVSGPSLEVEKRLKELLGTRPLVVEVCDAGDIAP
jgi:hypothetical protein